MFDNMVLRYMPNSDPWGPPGTRVMTTFVFLCQPSEREEGGGRGRGLKWDDVVNCGRDNINDMGRDKGGG